MRVLLLLLLATATLLACHAAPQPQRDTNLQRGNSASDSTPFVEEVVVASTLHVKSPTAGRQARTNTKTSLQDGARVSEMKPKYVNFS